MTFELTPAEDRAEVHINTYNRPPGDLLRYGDPSDGSTAFEQAIRQYQMLGDVVTLPPLAQRWRLTRPVRAVTNDPAIFSQGVQIEGAGVLRSVVEVCFDHGSAFELGTHADNHFGLQASIAGLQIVGGRKPNGLPYMGRGVEVRRSYQPKLINLWIKELANDAIYSPVLAGDPDACGQLLIDGCRLEAGGRGWAVNLPAADGCNENTGLQITRSSIRGYGDATELTSAPASGGLRIEAQLLQVDGLLIAECPNAGIYLPGGPGITTGVYMRGLALENNGHRAPGAPGGWHLYSVGGIDSMLLEGFNLYSNSQFRCRTGIELDGDIAPGNGIIRGVRMRGGVVRCNHDGEYTAFLRKGAQVFDCPPPEAISYQTDNFGSKPGQHKLSGWAA